MKKHEIKYEFSSPHSDLHETVEYVFDRTGERITQRDVLRIGVDKPDDVQVFAVSHDYIMTEIIVESFNPMGHIRRHRTLSEKTKRMGARSFPKGTLYRLHPSFIDRLSAVGSISNHEPPPHTLTYLTSRRARIGWAKIVSEPGTEELWTKWMPAEIFQPSESVVIELSDLRVCKFQVLAALLDDLKSVPREKEEKNRSNSWKEHIQAEAERIWLKLLDRQCSPSKNNIKDLLAKWCRQNGVVTDLGKYPTEQYIARHVLANWQPPLPKARPQQ